MKHFIKTLFFFSILILCFTNGAFAQHPMSFDKSFDKGDSVRSITETVKSCKKYDGLFPIYQDTITGAAYIQIAAKQIGKEFIYFSYTVNGVAEAWQTVGDYREDKIFSIQKYFKQIEFQTENTSYWYDSSNALARSAGSNINKPLLASEKIIAQDSTRTQYLIAADNLFLAENFDQVKPSPIPGLPPNMVFSLGNLDKEKTQYASIRNYPENTDVIIKYVYDNPQPTNWGGEDVTDARYVSIEVQHSLIEVPHNNFQPRFDDPRIGFFTDESNDMTSTSPTPYHDVIHHWNLVKKYPDSALSEPVTPITYWIENTTPVEFRETIMKAGLAWNEAFERAGFKNAIVMKIQPDTATWDAGDIRYNVIRWVSSPHPSYGGLGPSFVNPRTGEILGADIMLEYVYMTNRLRLQKIFSTAGLDGITDDDNNDNAATSAAVHYRATPNQNYFCEAGDYTHNATLFGEAAMDALGFSDIEKKELIKQSLYFLVLHEMGHTLGLTHNMKSSNLWSPAQINDTALTHETGLVGSVMDYPAVNLALDQSKQGQYFTMKPGPYDKWAIEYAYSPALADATAEHDRLEKILDRSTDPQLAYGNDADDMRTPGIGVDPRVMVGDMSNDAITYEINRMRLVDTVMQGIQNKYADTGKSYQELLNAYYSLTGEFAIAAGVVSRYIGGVYVDRAFKGQSGGTQPYTPVAYADQKRAMAGLSAYVFGVNAFASNGNLYAYLQRQKRGFNNFGDNEDPKIHDRVLAIQRSVLVQLLHPAVLKRINDSRLYKNEYSLGEYMQDLTDAIFKDDAKSTVSTFRQNLQEYYVARLIQIIKSENQPQGTVVVAISGTPMSQSYDEPSQAEALYTLKSINALLAKSKSSDALTQAHRDHITLQIQRALAVKE